jgi:hypothetical protein
MHFVKFMGFEIRFYSDFYGSDLGVQIRSRTELEFFEENRLRTYNLIKFYATKNFYNSQEFAEIIIYFTRACRNYYVIQKSL